MCLDLNSRLTSPQTCTFTACNVSCHGKEYPGQPLSLSMWLYICCSVGTSLKFAELAFSNIPFVTGGERKGNIICPKWIISLKKSLNSSPLLCSSARVTLNKLVSFQFPGEALDSPDPLPLKSHREHLTFSEKVLKSWSFAYSWMAFCTFPNITRTGPAIKDFLYAFITAWKSWGQRCFVNTKLVVAMVCKKLENKGSSVHGWKKTEMKQFL